MNTFFKHRLNIDSLIGKGQTVIDIKITQDTAIFQVSKKIGDADLLTVDLQTNRVLKRQLITSEPTAYEYYNGSLSYVSISKPDTLYRSAFRNDNVFKTSLQEFHVSSSSQLAGNLRQTFFVHHLYGISWLNNNGNAFFKRNTYGGVNEITNTISQPVNDTLNIISGGNEGNNTGIVIAVNNSDVVKWQKKVTVSKLYDGPQLYNYPSCFLVCGGRTISALRKSDGSIIWQKKFDRDFKAVLGSKERFVIVFLTNDQMPNLNDPEHQLVVASVEIADFKYKLNYKGLITGNASFGLNNECLILADKNTCRSINLRSNKVDVKRTENYGSSFRYITDFHSFKSYFHTYDGVIYW